MRFAFLLYFSRSGSTMLANRIAAHLENVVVFPEGDFIGILFSKGDVYVRELSASRLMRLLRLDQKLDSIAFTDEEWRTVTEKCARRGIYSLLCEVVRCYALKKNVSSPDLALFQRGTLLSFAREIIKAVPEAQFIHIYRDPRAAINSIVDIRRRKFTAYPSTLMGRNDVVGLSRNWAGYTDRVAALKTNYPELVKEIRYEDFCRNVEGGLHSIGRFMQVDYSQMGTSSRLEVSRDEREIHHHIYREPLLGRLSAWQTELQSWRGYVIENRAGTQMEARGYEKYFSTNATLARRVMYSVLARLDYIREGLVRLIRWPGKVARNPRRHVLGTQAALNRMLSRIRDRYASDRPSSP